MYVKLTILTSAGGCWCVFVFSSRALCLKLQWTAPTFHKDIVLLLWSFDDIPSIILYTIWNNIERMADITVTWNKSNLFVVYWLTKLQNNFFYLKCISGKFMNSLPSLQHVQCKSMYQWKKTKIGICAHSCHYWCYDYITSDGILLLV